ncbi:MAG: hypothetical protein E7Z93_00065 [Cyanobacteria bacterium SIG32]|nr:hypothetical protein [Cyanobacteria bacterium SIG32]
MTFVNIISAIGNNKSIYPLLVRDCGIENPVKVAMTYNQNKEDKKIAWLATRERILDEYSVSGVWLGTIPLIDKAGGALMRKVKGLNADVNLKLFAEDDNYNKNLATFEARRNKGLRAKKPEIVQGFEYNIQKFKNVTGAEEAVKDMINVKNNKKLFNGLMNTKFIASVVLPIALMGWVIPKLIFASSAKKKMEAYRKESELAKLNTNFGSSSTKSFDQFVRGNQNLTSFQGGLTSFLTGLTTVQKMAVTDGGYAAGRISTARNKNEAADIGIKMAGMMFLNYIAPQWIEKGLNLITDVSLDPKMLVDKRFLASIKYDHLDLPKSDSASDLLTFIDSKPNSTFTQAAKKAGKIVFLKDKNGKELNIRDPRAYVDVEDLGKFRKQVESFAKKAKNSGNVAKYAKKSLGLRSVTILANIALSSFLLAYCLPKAQFLFREWFTGSKLDPGLVDNSKAKKNKAA